MLNTDIGALAIAGTFSCDSGKALGLEAEMVCPESLVVLSSTAMSTGRTSQWSTQRTASGWGALPGRDSECRSESPVLFLGVSQHRHRIG